MRYLLAILRLAFPEFVERYEHQQARKRSIPIWHALFANSDERPAVLPNRERSSQRHLNDHFALRLHAFIAAFLVALGPYVYVVNRGIDKNGPNAEGRWS